MGSEWRDKAQFLSALQSGEVAKSATSWPVFLKVCHLTQSSSRGTLIIKSAAEMAEKVQDKSLAAWTDQKWAFRAHDFERKWVKEGDILTNAIAPGMIVQG